MNNEENSKLKEEILNFTSKVQKGVNDFFRDLLHEKCKIYPNDQELGAEVRRMFQKKTVEQDAD